MHYMLLVFWWNRLSRILPENYPIAYLVEFDSCGKNEGGTAPERCYEWQ